MYGYPPSVVVPHDCIPQRTDRNVFCSDQVPESIYRDLPPKLRKEVDIDTSRPSLSRS